METKLQDSSKLHNLYENTVANYKLCYLVKRIDEDDILVDRVTRDAILNSMASGVRFIQVREYTLMINSIKSIDPRWGEPNVPKAPSLPYMDTWHTAAGIGHSQAQKEEYETLLKAYTAVFGKNQLENKPNYELKG